MANSGAARRRALKRAGVWGALVAVSAVSLAGCSAIQPNRLAGAEPLERVVGPNDPVKPGGGRYQVGKAYSIGGQTYVPREDPHLDEVGMASWYGGAYHHGTRTSNGEVVDRTAITAAHRTMPLPSYARVTSLATGRSIIVRINDRGPFARGRIIDLSEKTAELLDIKGRGVSKIRVQYVGKAGLAGSDQKTLMASLRGPGIAPGADDRTLVAAADLGVGPRRNALPQGGTQLASASPTAPVTPANVLAPARPSLPSSARALVGTSDPTAFELAGVGVGKSREMIAAMPKPATTVAEVIEAEMPGASGAPMALVPVSAPATPPGWQVGPAGVDARSSFVAERHAAAHHAAATMARFGGGESPELVD